MSLLEIKNVSKSFDMKGSTLQVINDFNFTAEKGDLIALTGPSGAGKSTLLHIIGGLDKPTKGSVIFNDIDIYNMKEIELNVYRGKNMGFVRTIPFWVVLVAAIAFICFSSNPSLSAFIVFCCYAVSGYVYQFYLWVRGLPNPVRPVRDEN